MMADAFIALLLMVIGLLWMDGMKALERANAAARELCARSGLSLLDETAALASRRWVCESGGRRVLRRTYTFDYSEDGTSRATGFIILHGYRLASIGLAPDDAPRRHRNDAFGSEFSGGSSPE